MNHAWLPVRRRPRVALLATGDELVLPGEPLGPARSSAPTARRWPRWSGLGRRAGRPRHRRRRAGRAGGAPARPSTASTCSSPPAAPRSASTTWCGSAGRARARARLLEDRDAAGQAADVRPARRPCRCSACPATRSRPRSAPCCSCARHPAGCWASIPPAAGGPPCSARLRANDRARTTCAPAATARRRPPLVEAGGPSGQLDARDLRARRRAGRPSTPRPRARPATGSRPSTSARPCSRPASGTRSLARGAAAGVKGGRPSRRSSVGRAAHS